MGEALCEHVRPPPLLRAQVYLSITDLSTGEVQVIQEWNHLTNLPDSLAGAARNLKAAVTYNLSLISSQESSKPRSERIYVSGPEAAKTTVLRSQLGTLIDYYISFSGEANLDGAIRGYRDITGVAPLYGLWYDHPCA